MYSSPLNHQADHPALVVECVVQLLLLRALRGLRMVGAQQLKIKNNVSRAEQEGGFFHRGGKEHFTTLGSVVLKGYWAINTGHS